MAKPSVGNLPQQQSRTALAAHVAATLASVGTQRERRDRWISNTLGLSLGSNGLERAAARCADELQPWLLAEVAAAELEAECSLVIFPGNGRARPKLLRGLRKTGAVRQLIVTRSRRDVVCVLLYALSERQRVFEEIDRLGEPMVWEEILEEDRQVEAIAWQTLAKRLGAAEGFAKASAAPK